MDGFGFLSEDILRASVLVPKRRAVEVPEPKGLDNLPLEVATQNSPAARSIAIDRVGTVHMKVLKTQYDLEAKRLADANEEARAASEAMNSIMAQIMNLVEENPPSFSSSIVTSPIHTAANWSSKENMNFSMEPQVASPPPNNVNVLADVSVQSKSKFLSRKPRTLLFARSDPDWMLSCTLDGSLQRWSLDRRSIVTGGFTSLPLGFNEACWAEDMCLSQQGGHVAMVLGSPSGSASAEQVNLVDKSSEMTMRLAVQPIDLSSNPRLLTPSAPIHSKSLASVISFYDGPNERSLFIAGGCDRAVALWDADLAQSDGHAITTELHRRHTSAVHALCQQPLTRTLWSGGADSRLVAYCLAKRQPVYEQKLEGRVSHILSNPNDPQKLILTLSRQSDQFRLLDCRAPTASTTFGWPETGNISRYLTPSWHHAGNLIACGASSNINFWDLRYLPHPVQRIDCGQTDRRYLTTAFHPTRDLIVALATDGTVSFVDYLVSS